MPCIHSYLSDACKGNRVSGEEERTMQNHTGMNRRKALKQIGTCGAVALASVGVAPLVSCARRKEAKRLILYFTATGNCLYAARRLADEETVLLSIPQMVRRGQYEFEADEIGIVYPIYMHMPPNMVRRFIQRARLEATYKFAVLTYGMRHLNAVSIWDEITRKVGMPFDYIATLLMVDNWLPNFDMDEQKRLDKHIPENLARIADDVARHKMWHESVTQEECRLHDEAMQRFCLDPEVGFLERSERCFAVTDACIGCGACVSVCPRGNYSLRGDMASMRGDCDLCFACIQNCPQKAIRFVEGSDIPYLKNGEKNPNARFRNAHVTLTDIRRANRQNG